MHAYLRAHKRTVTSAAMTLAMAPMAVVMAASASAINTKVVE